MPDQVYALRLSMYQKGVPFYKKDCELDPRPLCTWPWPIGRSEDSYFSKPMEVRFETNKNYDERGIFAKIRHFTDVTTFFGWIVSEPTRGENK